MQKTYTFALENGKDTEDVDISVDGNFVQYHVQDNDTEVWVINDFNTVSTEYIQIQKKRNKCTVYISFQSSNDRSRH